MMQKSKPLTKIEIASFVLVVSFAVMVFTGLFHDAIQMTVDIEDARAWPRTNP